MRIAASASLMDEPSGKSETHFVFAAIFCREHGSKVSHIDSQQDSVSHVPKVLSRHVFRQEQQTLGIETLRLAGVQLPDVDGPQPRGESRPDVHAADVRPAARRLGSGVPALMQISRSAVRATGRTWLSVALSPGNGPHKREPPRRTGAAEVGEWVTGTAGRTS